MCLRGWQRFKLSSAHSRLSSIFLAFRDYAKMLLFVLNIFKSNCGWQPSREEDKNLNSLRGTLDISFNIHPYFYFDVLGAVF